MNSFSQEQVMAAYQKAPQPIRDAFTSEVTASVVLDLKTKYRLHVDMAGNLGKEIGYLMLGLRSPAEFFGNLMISGSDEATARALVEEVNTRIFIPLKNQVRSAQQKSPVESYTAPAPSAAQPKEPTTPAPALDYIPPAPTLPGSPAPAPMPATPPTPEIEAPVVEAPKPEPVVETPPAPPVPQPAAPVTPGAPLSTAPSRSYGADPYREPI